MFGCAVVRKSGGVWGGGEVCACPQSASPRACMRVCLIAGSASVRCSVVGRSLSPSVADYVLQGQGPNDGDGAGDGW